MLGFGEPRLFDRIPGAAVILVIKPAFFEVSGNLFLLFHQKVKIS